MRLIKNKHSQTEVVVTVLLVLISIVAVAIVATFVVNFVREKLVKTGCFDTVGYLSINTEGGLTYYNSSAKLVYISIEKKGTFDLFGFVVGIEDDVNAKSYKIFEGSETNEIKMYSGSSGQITLPLESGEKRTYSINISNSSLGESRNITKLSISAILKDNRICDVADEKEVSSY